MKKIILISVAFLFVFLLNSCSADEIEEQQPNSTDLQTVKPETPTDLTIPNNGISTYKGSAGGIDTEKQD